MNKKLKGWLFALAIVAVLMIPILIDYSAKNKVGVASYNDYIDLVDSGDFYLVYFGNLETEGYADIKESLVSLKKDFDIEAKAVDYTKISGVNLAELSTTFEGEEAYVFVKEGKVAYVSEGTTTLTRLKVLLDKYINDIIPEEEISYKTVETYTEYMNAIKSKSVIMTVFGTDDCSWCNKFRPIYNEVALDYDLDIYYINSKYFDNTEYTKIMNSGLTIPASCRESGVEAPLSSGFGTPLTLFTKSGKVTDCISGYVNEETLISKLKSVGMIK